MTVTSMIYEATVYGHSGQVLFSCLQFLHFRSQQPRFDSGVVSIQILEGSLLLQIGWVGDASVLWQL